jgi:hypothetical protein
LWLNDKTDNIELDNIELDNIELAGFTRSTLSVLSTCFQQTTIVSVPKKAKVTCLNDYRPIALTSVAMKCFERLVMAHINTIMPETLNPLQFAKCPN